MKKKEVALRMATLASEAQWLEEALANSEGGPYTQQYRDGFAAAAGWVRFHSQHEHLITGRFEETQ